MRWSVRSFLVVVVCCGASAIGLRPAAAECFLRPGDAVQRAIVGTDPYAAVFIGRVESVGPATQVHGAIFTQVRFSVRFTFRSAGSSETLMQPGGSIGREDSYVEDTFSFARDHYYFVAADGAFEPNGALSASSCGATEELTPYAIHDLVAVARAAHIRIPEEQPVAVPAAAVIVDPVRELRGSVLRTFGVVLCAGLALLMSRRFRLRRAR